MVYVRLEFPDGSIWSVDREKIEHDYASHYAEKVADPYERKVTYELNLEYIRASEEEFKDWMFNNMNWSDLKAVMVDPPVDIDYDEMFCEAEVMWSDETS